jgi:tartronate-semialdehyde synthase
VLIDVPFGGQTAEIEFDIETYQPLPVYKPAARRSTKVSRGEAISSQ